MLKKTKKELILDKIKFLEELGTIRSRELDKNKTKWEVSLYNTLTKLGFKFKFQVPVVVNKEKAPQLFILDFVISPYNLIIEADGKQYHSSKKAVSLDNRRTKLLRKEGYQVLRFWNTQISSLKESEILAIITQRLLKPA